MPIVTQPAIGATANAGTIEINVAYESKSDMGRPPQESSGTGRVVVHVAHSAYTLSNGSTPAGVYFTASGSSATWTGPGNLEPNLTVDYSASNGPGAAYLVQVFHDDQLVEFASHTIPGPSQTP